MYVREVVLGHILVRPLPSETRILVRIFYGRLIINNKTGKVSIKI